MKVGFSTRDVADLRKIFAPVVDAEKTNVYA